MARTADKLAAAPPPSTARPPRPRSRWGDDLVTVAAGTWLIVGLFVDGWAHNNLSQLETFFTPWHALLYSGFAACAGWLGWQAIRHQERGYRLGRALPVGYGLGVLGVAVFGLGGVSDGVWHTLLGIEVSIDALLSPPHLVMFSGALLLLTVPLRAAWHAPDTADGAVSARRFLPALLSLVLSTLLVAFFFQYWGAFSSFAWSAEEAAWALDNDLAFFVQSTGVAEVLVTNLILLFPLLLATRRWRLPLGTATILFTAVGVGLQAMAAFADPLLIAPPLLAGVAADLLAARSRLGPASPAVVVRTWAAVVPVVLWSLFFAAVAVGGGIGWPATLWGGTILFAALSGVALSLLAVSPAVPVGDGARGG